MLNAVMHDVQKTFQNSLIKFAGLLHQLRMQLG